MIFNYLNIQLKIGVVFLILFSSIEGSNAQGFFYLGYNFTNHTKGFSTLDFDRYDFNNTNYNLVTPMTENNISRGVEIGFAGNDDYFGLDMGYRRRKLVMQGYKVDNLTGDEEYHEIRLLNNVMQISIMGGIKSFKLGYQIEIGTLKRIDKLDKDGDWERLRNKDFAPSFNLVSRIRLPISEEKLELFVQPYWRITSNVLELTNRINQRDEPYNLRGVGISVMLCVIFE